MTEPDKPSSENLSTGSRPGESILAAIRRVHGVGSEVSLGDSGEPDPVSLRRDEGEAPEKDDRYVVLGEIARGGIGVIYKCLDRDLNRQVALKVLRPEYEARLDVIQRFIEEAQVGGQLQHPGIVPIYGIGVRENGRPSFAMKLIKGQTLAELLGREDPGCDLFVIFEQIARTVAYAHSRGVIHRDLKPANVMVGAYGEVQVVDWGLAKLLGQEEPTPDRAAILTVRSGPEGSQSLAGNVLGTPAYMPPEQARGENEEVDRRADVFALGAILLEILTGAPPYGGSPMDQLIAASRGSQAEALARLDASDAAEEVKALARDCLRPEREERPASAQVVAERFSGYLAAVEERARASEIETLRAEHQARRERQARQRSLVLAGAVLLVLAGTTGAWLWWRSDVEAREDRVRPAISQAMREATGSEGRGDWPAAVAAARRAVDLALSEGVDGTGAEALLGRLEEARRRADEAAAIAAGNERLLVDLDEARGRELTRVAEGADPAGIDAAFAAAFARHVGPPESAAERLAASPLAPAFAAHLDSWSLLRRHLDPPGDGRGLAALSRRIDPAGGAARDALHGDPAAMADFAREHRKDLSPSLSPQFGLALLLQGDAAGAVALLREQAVLHADDAWVHLTLAAAAARIPDARLAAHHAGAAAALRPKLRAAWQRLAAACRAMGDEIGAESATKKSTELASAAGGVR